MHQVVFVVLLLVQPLFAATVTKDCAAIASEKGTYDISALLGKVYVSLVSSSHFVSIPTTDDLYEYKVSICTDNFPCGDCNKAGYCQIFNGGFYWEGCIGTWKGAVPLCMLFFCVLLTLKLGKKLVWSSFMTEEIQQTKVSSLLHHHSHESWTR